jgi:hypothetical protein
VAHLSALARGAVQSVKLVPSVDAFEFVEASDRVDFVVPEFAGDRIIAISCARTRREVL